MYVYLIVRAYLITW